MTIEELNNLNINEASKQTDLVDNFPRTTKLLDKKLKDKEDNIQKVLQEWNLRDIFEKFLLSDTENKRRCIEGLLNCENDETKIKGVILANLPEWYAYNVSTNEVVKTEVKKSDDYTWATNVDKKWEEAVQKEEEAVLNENEAKSKKEKIERARNIAKVARQNLLNNHPKWKEIDEKTRKEAEKFKKELPEETKKQLEEKGYDESFINDYILLRVTLNEVKGDSSFDRNQVEQFEKSVNELSALDIILKNIDNSCNIPDTNLSSFSSENISQTRTELFNEDVWNKSLIEARDNNKDHHDYSEMFPEMWEDDMFIKYGQFLEWNLKNYWNQYKDDYLGFMNHLNDLREQASKWKVLNQEEKDFLSLPWIIKWIKEKMDNDTKNMVEELCIISQIKWMYMCMWEWADFNLNKANEIKSENWILTVRGHIDWVDFAIRQDTKNPEARLQTSQKLARSPDGNTFSIGWKDNDNFVNSNFILPSQDEIFNSITETLKDNQSLANFDNQSAYFKNLQSNIMWNIEKKYENTKYVNHYMQNQVKWEKIVKDTLGLINKTIPNIANDKTLMNGINKASNKDLFDFMTILKFNIDNSTDYEKEKLNEIIKKILEITDDYKNTNWEKSERSFKYYPIIENYLKNDTWLKEWNDNSRLRLLSDLFKYYSENSKDTRTNSDWNDWIDSKMIINDLHRDLFEYPDNDSLTSKAWIDEQEKNGGADDELKLALNSLDSVSESSNMA